MDAAFRGNTTKAEARERSRKENQNELGVCRIRRQTAKDRRPQTLGSGFVVKDLEIYPGISFSYCLISSDKVFPKDDCNIESYFLDFKKLNSTNLKTVELRHVSAKPSKFTRISGLVLIPINPSKEYNKDQSIFTYRPFKIANEGIPPDKNLRCYFVEEDSADTGRTNFSLISLALKRSETVSMQYQLHEDNERPYTKYDDILSRGCHRKPYGAVILMCSNKEFVAVGALTFTDNEWRNICCPLFPLPLHTSKYQWKLCQNGCIRSVYYKTTAVEMN